MITVVKHWQNPKIRAVIFLAVSVLLFCLLVYLVIVEHRDSIDAPAFRFFQSYVSPTHTRFAMMVTFLGTGSFLIPSYMLIIIYLLRKNCSTHAWLVAVMAISGLLLGWVLKELFHRSRPLFPLVSGAGGYSFPSGHALGGFIFSGVLICLVWQTERKTHHKWMFVTLITALGAMIGLSRIYLHVHYATDVMGSLLVTLIWFSLLNLFFPFNSASRPREIEANENSYDDAYV